MGSELSRVIETLAPCKDIRIVADDIEFESIEEFISESRGKAPRVMKISAREPYLTIDFYPSSARLYVSSSDLTSSGLFAKLVSQIEESERRPRFLHSFWYVVTSTGVIQLAFAIPALKPINYLEIWLTLANVLWVLRVAFIYVKRFSLIQPIAANDPRTFWQRNSDSAVVAIFSAVFGALCGAVATKVADRVWPTSSPSVVDGPAAETSIASSPATITPTQKPRQ